MAYIKKNIKHRSIKYVIFKKGITASHLSDADSLCLRAPTTASIVWPF